MTLADIKKILQQNGVDFFVKKEDGRLAIINVMADEEN